MRGSAAGNDAPLRDNLLRGRRVGKPLSAYQRELMASLLPRLSLDPSRPLDPAALFTTPKSELRLEIGFGGGEHLLAAARREPDVGFLGCEPFVNGMARALADVAGADSDNIRLHAGDAGDVIDALPLSCLARVYLFYPDPWPKRRQRKRRFVSDGLLARLARAMRPGAELRFASDIDDYTGWTLARLARSPDFRWEPACAKNWQQPWPEWQRTRYEAKAVAEGRRPCYLTAVRR